ncbi:aminoacyl-tRNA deacylase [Actinomycetaceae bacterium TAE3-ERU4]|nr:aminoacyl-tRNA deacylase [Actinomycetaceae bacterium TAE3-ERU4]
MDDGYALDTANVLGVEPERIFKTLMAQADKEIVCALVPASKRLSFKLLSKAVGAKKSHLLDPCVAERVTGYVTGGISPFGQRHAHRIFVDDSALLYESILVSGGKRSLSLEISPDSLGKAKTAVFLPLAEG